MPPVVESQCGAFYVVEGPNGAGKTTFIAELAAYLRAKGCEVVVTREPGGSGFAEGLRAVLKDPARGAGGFATALVFNGARADHAATVIAPAIARGAVVLCDRYYPSTEIFQIELSEEITLEQADLLRSLHQLFPQPDLTVFILPTADLLAARHALTREADRFEGNARELRAYEEYAARFANSHASVCLRPSIDEPSLSSTIPSIFAATTRRVLRSAAA